MSRSRRIVRPVYPDQIVHQVIEIERQSTQGRAQGRAQVTSTRSSRDGQVLLEVHHARMQIAAESLTTARKPTSIAGEESASAIGRRLCTLQCVGISHVKKRGSSSASTLRRMKSIRASPQLYVSEITTTQVLVALATKDACSQGLRRSHRVHIAPVLITVRYRWQPSDFLLSSLTSPHKVDYASRRLPGSWRQRSYHHVRASG